VIFFTYEVPKTVLLFIVNKYWAIFNELIKQAPYVPVDGKGVTNPAFIFVIVELHPEH
jgi:hypothetical protein